MGASIIEKHFTLNKKLKGPDHSSSIDEEEFNQLIKNIKLSNIMMGTSKKECTKSELKNKIIVRKSIYASENIQKGERFSEKNLISLRPDKGVSAIFWQKIIGKKAKKSFKKLDLVKV